MEMGDKVASTPSQKFATHIHKFTTNVHKFTTYIQEITTHVTKFPSRIIHSYYNMSDWVVIFVGKPPLPKDLLWFMEMGDKVPEPLPSTLNLRLGTLNPQP